MSEYNTINQAGKIILKQGKKGIEFWAFNHERKKDLCIGTLSGQVYEKTVPILRQPEPSFCLPLSELAAIEQEGGQFLRFIARGEVSGTYVISLDDFKLHGERYFARGYGYQTRVPLTKFQHSLRVSKRNPIIDNPVISASRDIVRDRQMNLFQ
jgi:hypothetical protein